tara:strand:- start:504 stop:671 length:168 start_codon:yes stop_codon:yes gene_type:complete
LVQVVVVQHHLLLRQVQELVNLEVILSFILHHTILIPLLNSFVEQVEAVVVDPLQ